jgi:hypothetical protein
MDGNSNESSPISDNISSSNDSSSDSSGWRTGYIQGNTFSNKKITYRVINGMAIFEGDIILATTPMELERLKRPLVKGVGRTGEHFRWPRGEIPYVIQSTLPNQNRVSDAILHWQNNTPILFVKRTDSNAKYYPNYVSFTQYVPKPGEKQEEVFHCSSAIGMQGRGEQLVIVSDQCITGDVIHEIGHAVGLWHEISRTDREDFITIVWDNIDRQYIHNFDQHVTDGDDIGEYDYCSIMHYGAWFFANKPGLTKENQTIRVRQPNRPCGDVTKANSIGQKNGLSDGDIQAVIEMYGYTDPTVIRNTLLGYLEAYMVRSVGRPSERTANLYHNRRMVISPSPLLIGPWNLLDLKTQFSFGLRPAIVEDADTSLEVFWTESNRLHHAYHNGPEWPFQQTGPETPILQEVKTDAQNISYLGHPVVGRDAEGRLEVFFVGGDDPRQLYFALQSESDKKLDLFHPLGHPPGVYWSPNRSPAVAQNADGRLEVFIVGADNILYHRWQTEPKSNSQWSEKWETLSDPSVSDPVLARNADGRLEVFVIRYEDKRLYHRWQIKANDSSQWSGWASLQTTESILPRSRPAVAQNADGRLEVFIVGADNILYHRWQIKANDSSQWLPADKWETLVETSWPFSSNPVVISARPGTSPIHDQMAVFMVGSDKQLLYSMKDNATEAWSSWYTY